MDICGYSSNIGLKRTPIKDLTPDLDNILIVAVMISKQRMRKFLDKTKENEEYKGVWGFTLRDSPRDYINVTYWGPCEEVSAANDKFYTGDVVELRHPRINVRKFNESSEQYCPMVTSPYSLSLNEHSQILPFHGDTFVFTKLLNFPTKPLSGFVPLRDIHNEGANMKERSIDILAGIRSVGPVKTIRLKNGQDTDLREVILFDHTSSDLKMTIWETDIILRATKWKPRTILFITDTKVMYSAFLKTYTVSVTGRSIVTENPIGHEAVSLAAYAKTLALDTVDFLEQFITDLPDPESIQNVMSVQQIHNKIGIVSQETSTEPQFTALMFVFITQLDLDGPYSVTRIRCSSCKNYLKPESPICDSSDCPVQQGSTENNLDFSFDIKVHVSDHTGTLTNCRLSGRIAEQVLNCTIQQFMTMSDDQKSKLKWKCLMERCAVRILVLLNRFVPRISIVSCSRADPLEAAQRIPLC